MYYCTCMYMCVGVHMPMCVFIGVYSCAHTCVCISVCVKCRDAQVNACMWRSETAFSLGSLPSPWALGWSSGWQVLTASAFYWSAILLGLFLFFNSGGSICRQERNHCYHAHHFSPAKITRAPTLSLIRINCDPNRNGGHSKNAHLMSGLRK